MFVSLSKICILATEGVILPGTSASLRSVQKSDLTNVAVEVLGEMTVKVT